MGDQLGPIGPLERRLESNRLGVPLPKAAPRVETRFPTKELNEAAAGLSGLGYDPDAEHSAQQIGPAYSRRLSQTKRDLSPASLERARETSYALWQMNPLAKRTVELTRDFVTGEGVKVTAGGDDANLRKQMQDVIDDFWDDSINDMDVKLHEKVMELGLFGEGCWTVTVNMAGHVELGYLDPANIADVITDPANVERLVSIETTELPVLVPIGPTLPAGSDAIAPGTAKRRYRIVHVDTDPQSEWYGRWIGAGQDVAGAITEQYASPDGPRPYAGACFYWAVNKITTSKRGLSDLTSLIDYVDGYDQMAFNEVDRALLLKIYAWDVTLTGAQKPEIDSYALENPTIPMTGGVRFHNENVKWEPVTPNLNSGDTAAGFDVILSYIATGAGMPKTWLNGQMDVNRATASELGVPGFKRLVQRQNYVLASLRRLITFVLDQAEMAGMLTKRLNVGEAPESPGLTAVDGMGDQPATQAKLLKPVPWVFSITAPELIQADLAKQGAALADVTNAVVSLVQNKVIDINVAQEMAASLLGQFGIEVDLESMRERLVKALEAEQKAAAEAFKTQQAAAAVAGPPEQSPPGGNGNGQGPGGGGGGNGNGRGPGPDAVSANRGLSSMARLTASAVQPGPVTSNVVRFPTAGSSALEPDFAVLGEAEPIAEAYDRSHPRDAMGRFTTTPDPNVERDARIKKLQDELSRRLVALGQDPASLPDRGRATIGRLYREAFTEGARSAVPDWAWQGTDYTQRVGRLIEDQHAYLTGFARAIGTEDLSAAQIEQRANLYAASLRSVYNEGRAVAIRESGTETVTWMGVGDSNTCALCLERIGQEYTVDELMLIGLPGSGDFGEVCEGAMNCRCWIEGDVGDLGQPGNNTGGTGED